MCPLEACILQVNDALLCHPKKAQNHLVINCSHLVDWSAQLNQSSWILSHLQETAKNTSLPSLFDPLTLALSILILFDLSVFFYKIKNLHTLDPLFAYTVTTRSPTGLCPESPAQSSLHTWLRVLSQLHFYNQICWWYFGSGPHFQQWWDRILGWGRETYIMVPGQQSLSESEQN